MFFRPSTYIGAAFKSTTIRQTCRLLSYSGDGPHYRTPVELDDSFVALLREDTMSLSDSRPSEIVVSLRRELQELPLEGEDDAAQIEPLDPEEHLDLSEASTRKSAAAAFGSQRIRSVILPQEMIGAVERLIAESDKPMLHNDASRLFLSEKGLWSTIYDANYKSRRQATRHNERDGTAFASVAFPSHFAAITAVLNHIRQRLGKSWNVTKIIDWGSGVGSGLWASLDQFQKENDLQSDTQASFIGTLSNSTILSYVSLDKRNGLTSMAKKLLDNVDTGNTSLSWRKSYAPSDRLPRSQSNDVLALSAFYLSSLPNGIARKELVKEMWESGARTLVIIDHDSAAGFESVVQAREQLLRMGNKESADPSTTGEKEHIGCHVVAPCPHDGACPLHQPGSSKLKCSFSQRLQRPAFIRKTKHVKAGHEDMGYSYVVIQRGPRPDAAHWKSDHTSDGTLKTEDYPQNGESQAGIEEDITVERRLSLDAYGWPRLVLPPLKRSGHIILDGCTKEGMIMRMIIPRSQGKQPYYDARKSSWGDLFPHPPKNKPQIQYQPSVLKSSKDLSGQNSKIEAVGQQTGYSELKETSYERLTSEIKQTKKRIRRERTIERRAKSDPDYD